MTTTMGSEVTQPTQQSGSSAKEVAQSVFRDYLEQLSVTSLAVKHWWIQQYRKTRMAVKDIRDACIQIIEEKPQTKGGKGSVIDALADSSPMVCCDTDKFCLQETYFGISILVLSLTLGGIVGNLWTEFSWGPQLSVLQALLVIIMLPLQIYYGFSDLPSAGSIVKRRSALYLMLFFMGFSMGRLCQYSLVSTAPRIIPPLALAYMIDKFVHINSRKNPPPSGIRGTRIEMFLAVTVFSLFIVWCHLLLLRRLTLGSFFVSFLCVAINLQLLFAHFQLFFYGLCTLGEKWNLETMKEETDSHGHGHHRHHYWNLDNVNRWLGHSDIAFIIAILTLDVLLCTLY